MYKGVSRQDGGGIGGGGRWDRWMVRVGSRRQVIPSNWTVWSRVQEVLVIGPDKTGGP